MPVSRKEAALGTRLGKKLFMKFIICLIEMEIVLQWQPTHTLKLCYLTASVSSWHFLDLFSTIKSVSDKDHCFKILFAMADQDIY